VPGGKVAGVQRHVGVYDLKHLSLREEPIADTSLIENLDGARVQAACARADQFLAGAPLDNRDVDPAIATLRSFSRRRPAPASRDPHVDNHALIS
jgi:hypothetical protein